MAVQIFRSRQIRLAKRIDEFIDCLSEAGLLFHQGVTYYLSEESDHFAEKLEQMSRTEHQADTMRRDLERELYVKTLIPESRGDVLDLLESLDRLLDRFKAVMWQFEIEHPDIPKKLHHDFRELSAHCVESVEAVARSARAFFKDLEATGDHMHKVSYWESESDSANTRLQRTLFAMEELPLASKLQIRDFSRALARIADEAEDVADKLAIFVIKRRI